MLRSLFRLLIQGLFDKRIGVTLHRRCSIPELQWAKQGKENYDGDRENSSGMSELTMRVANGTSIPA